MKILGLIIALSLCVSPVAAKAFTRSDNNPEKIYMTRITNLFTSGISMGARSQAFSLNWGKIHETRGPNDPYAPTWTRFQFKGNVLTADAKYAALETLATLELGTPFPFLGIYEIGFGGAFGKDERGSHVSIGILEVGYGIGMGRGLNLIAHGQIPLSTSTKPNWFPDWLVGFQYSFETGDPKETKYQILDLPL